MNTSFSKKTLSFIAAGIFITCAMQAVAADISKLSLAQRTSDIVVPPKEGSLGILNIEGLEAVEGEIVEFTVSNIRNDIPMDVYLAFSTRPSIEGEWEPCLSGQIELDPKSLEILGAVHVRPVERFSDFDQDTSLGKAEFKTQSIVFTITLSDLTSPQLYGDTVFFQALAMPEKTMDFNRCQASEVDEYDIKR